MNGILITDPPTTQELTLMTTGLSFKLMLKMMVKSQLRRQESKLLKCKHKWTKPSPMLMPRELNNKLNMRQTLTTMTQLLNCKVS